MALVMNGKWAGLDIRATLTCKIGLRACERECIKLFGSPENELDWGPAESVGSNGFPFSKLGHSVGSVHARITMKQSPLAFDL